MSRAHRSRLGFALGFLTVLGLAGLGWSQSKRTVAPEELLPADAVVYANWSGVELQREAYMKSALHDVIEETSLGKFIGHVIDVVTRAMGAEAAGPGRELFEQVWRHGAVASVSFAQGSKVEPVATIVFPGAAAGGRAERLAELLQKVGAAPSEKIEHAGRTLHVVKTGTDTLAWWPEGDHVVFTSAGADPETALAVAAGRKPNLQSNAAFQAQRAGLPKSSVLTIWGDLGRAWSLMIQNSIAPANTLATLGVDGVKSASYWTTFEGRGMRSELRVEAPAPRRGIPKILLDQPKITLAELPALPEDTYGFWAMGLDLPQTVFDVLALVKEMGGLTDVQVEQGFEAIDNALGLNVRTDVFPALGNKLVVFQAKQADAGSFGLGFALETRDPRKLRAVVAQLVQLIEAQTQGQLPIVTEKVGEVEMYTIQVPALGPIMLEPSFAVAERWVVIGLTSSVVRDFARSQAGDAERWKPDAAFVQGRGDIPTTGNAISWSDPRPTVETILAFAPMIIEQINASQSNVQIDATLLPRAADLNRYLFPGHSAMIVDDRGLRWIGTSSLPLLASSNPNGISIGTVGAALLLPALQRNDFR